MKFGRLRTLRGQIEVSGGVAKANLIVADGLINYGLRVMRFTIWPETWAGSNPVYYTAILGLDTVVGNMDAGTNSQIAWAYGATADATPKGLIQQDRLIIDPDHIVNRDLFLSFVNTTAGTFNYLIETQVVELSDDEAIITIIKETSQS